jgi:hypothetical protein
MRAFVLVSILSAAVLLASQASADPVFFSTNAPDGKAGTLSRTPSPAVLQTETADDFILANSSVINQATFTGLIPADASLESISNVEVEIYHLFPGDTDPANQVVPNPIVPTRDGSPADFEIVEATRDGADGSLTFTPAVLADTFTAATSIVDGIHKLPGQTTGGEGAVTGKEVSITLTFHPPIALPADQYFFRPEVRLSSGNFLWLSAPKPIVDPGTPFVSDKQTWMRNDATPDVGGIFPNWLRVAKDIIGVGAFNASFSLAGETDADGDGVGDSLDKCSDTPTGAGVNADGCSIDQLAPCAGPASGVTWKNHGEYVSTFAHAANAFLAEGLITEDQKGAIVGAAGQSKCGKAR